MDGVDGKEPVGRKVDPMLATSAKTSPIGKPSGRAEATTIKDLILVRAQYHRAYSATYGRDNMGQALSDEASHQKPREVLVEELAVKFKEKCFTQLEFYSLRDVFRSLADQQDSIRYLKEDTISQFLEIPDVLGASPVVFQMVSYLGAFPFLREAPAVIELPQLIVIITLMTERFSRVLQGGLKDRTKLFFRSLAVYDRKLSEASLADSSPKTEDLKPSSSSYSTGFAIDQGGEDEKDEEYDSTDDDLIVTAFELLDVNEAIEQGEAKRTAGALIPSDNFRKLLMLLVLAAPLDPQESLSQYTDRFTDHELETLRGVAGCILAAFVDVESSPGIKYKHFQSVNPVLVPHLFNGFDALFQHFLFSRNLDLSRREIGSKEHIHNPEPANATQPLLSGAGEILNSHTLSQISLFLPGSSLFRRVRLLYSGSQAGFSMGSFESKVFNWRAPTILLVRGTRLDEASDGGQETAFAGTLPPKRFADGSKGEKLTFGVYIREPWKQTHRDCFGDSETVLFQLEPVHDVFPASTLNTDYVAYTKPPGNQPRVSFGCPHPKPTQAARRDTMHSLGSVSLMINDSFEFGVFNHDYKSKGGAFHNSIIRKRDFQDRFQIQSMEVWGCGGDEEAKAQADRWAWEEREAEARRKINLGTGDREADRALLEMAGLVGANRSGGSMA